MFGETFTLVGIFPKQYLSSHGLYTMPHKIRCVFSVQTEGLLYTVIFLILSTMYKVSFSMSLGLICFTNY